jgi:hypothetical protein
MDVVINESKDNSPAGVASLTTQGDFWLNALAQLGQDPVNTPLADLFRFHHQLEEGEWLVVSPIHWQVTHNDAMIVAYGEELNLTEAVAPIWFAEISQFLAQDGLKLVYHSASCWLLNATGKAPLISPNLPVIKHQSLMPILAELDHTMYWQRLFTELQMFLANHPLNSARDRAIPINGLWFWGGGKLISESQQAMRPIFTDDLIVSDSFAQSLAIDLDKVVFDEEPLVAMAYPKAETVEQLEQLTRKKTVNWYWNNAAYKATFKPWYKRFFCK